VQAERYILFRAPLACAQSRRAGIERSESTGLALSADRPRGIERAERRRRCVGGALLIGALSLLAPVRSGAGSASGPDANALVRKMVAAYHAASTIQETAEAVIRTPERGEYLQTSSIKYKRPNLLVLETSDPVTGSIVCYANTRTLTVYSGKQNIFTKRTAPKSYARLIPLIEKTSAEVRVPILQIFTPLSFLLAKGMPVEAQSFRYSGMAVVDGRKTYKVIGRATPDLMQKAAPAAYLRPDKSEVTFFIDPRTNLLVKVKAVLVWRATIPGRGKTRAQVFRTGYVLEETHRGTVLNAPIVDTAFVFAPPKGAVEIFQEAR